MTCIEQRRRQRAVNNARDIREHRKASIWMVEGGCRRQWQQRWRRPGGMDYYYFMVSDVVGGWRALRQESESYVLE